MTKKSEEWVELLSDAAEWANQFSPLSSRGWYALLVSHGQHLVATKRSMPNKLRHVTLGKTVRALRWAETAGTMTRNPKGRTMDVDQYQWELVEQAIEELLENETSEGDDPDEEGGGVAPSIWF